MKGNDPARAAALDILAELELHDAPLETLLDERASTAPLTSAAPGDERDAASTAQSRDARFVRQLVLGCVKWRDRIDWIVDQFSRQSVETLSPTARHILRIGTYQLMWLDRVPSRAAVHSSVELAKRHTHRGVASLVNAVLRRVAEEGDRVRYPDRCSEPGRHLSVFYSHPLWMVERWLNRWGECRTEEMLRVNNENPRLYIRLNKLRADIAAFEAALPDGHTVSGATGPLRDSLELIQHDGIFASAAYDRGLFYVQDMNAGLAVGLLEPAARDRILDTCSAPGGKTVQIAIATSGRARVVAADKSVSRLRRLRVNTRRLGLGNICEVAEDATLPSALAGRGLTFDRVLVDVPCSSTGVLCRRPDARWRRSPAKLRELAELQLAILRRAFDRLRPDGVLVYSTCSLEEEENEGVVDRFVESTPAAIVEPARSRFPGVPWADRFILTLPGRERGDGSFSARIRKVAA